MKKKKSLFKSEKNAHVQPMNEFLLQKYAKKWTGPSNEPHPHTCDQTDRWTDRRTDTHPPPSI